MKLFLLLNDVYEKVLISIVLLRLIKIKPVFKGIKWIFLGLVLLLCSVGILNLFVFPESFSSFLIIFLTAMYLKSFSDVHFLHILFIVGFLFGFISLNSIVSLDIIAVVFQIKFIEIYKSNLFYIIYVIIMKFNLAVFVVAINFFQKKMYFILDSKQYKQLSIIEILIFYILIIFKKQIVIEYNVIFSQFRIVFSIFLFISGSIIINLFNNERKQRMDLQNLLDMINFEQQYYKDVLEENDKMRRIKHDFKHVISLLERSIQIEDYSEVRKLIDSYKSTQINQINAIVTGNENLDYILNKKLIDCKTNGLNLKCIFEETDISFVEKSDLYIMLGNLLDNAIEGTYNKEIPITLKTIGYNDMLVIYCSNSTDELNIELSKGSLISTKSDCLSHGYGMSSIQMIAEKYNGSFSYRVEDHTFIAIIILVKRNRI